MGFLTFGGVLIAVCFLYVISQTLEEIRKELQTTNRTNGKLLTQHQDALSALQGGSSAKETTPKLGSKKKTYTEKGTSTTNTTETETASS